MADVVVFHHALGLTDGIRTIADRLRAGGHRVETPDLFDGAVFDELDAGGALAESIGFAEIADQGARTVSAGTSGDVVVIGFSLGALPAQCAAQTVPCVTAAALIHAAAPLGWFGDTWPDDVALQIHLGERDPWADEDAEAARQLEAAGGALYWYDTDRHLVCEPAHPDHDPAIAARILGRIDSFVTGR